MARARSSLRYSPGDLEHIRKGQWWMIHSFLWMVMLPILVYGAIMLIWGLVDFDTEQDRQIETKAWLLAVVLLLGALAIQLLLMVLHFIGIMRMLIGLHAGLLAYPVCLLLWLPAVWYNFKARRILREHGYNAGLLGAAPKQGRGGKRPTRKTA